jgi:hypothetical protein
MEKIKMTKELEALKKLEDAVKAKEVPLREFVQEYGDILNAAKEVETAREEDKTIGQEAPKNSGPIAANTINKWFAYQPKISGYQTNGGWGYGQSTYTVPTWNYYTTTGNTNIYGSTYNTTAAFPTYTITYTYG